jgi:hypothetical protein
VTDHEDENPLQEEDSAMKQKPVDSRGVLAAVLVVGLSMVAGCARTPAGTGTSSQADARQAAVFSYDTAEFSGAKPWTSEDFRNDPEDFQFAIIGDRTGGANVQKTFEIAMGQLNLLQPEFVINVGDIIEGYDRKGAQ